MSHFTRIDCKIQNLEAIEQALVEEGLGYEMADQRGNLRYVIAVKGKGNRNTVGFQKNEDNTYSLYAEYYGTGISAEQMAKVIQKAYRNQYNIALQNQGYVADWNFDETGVLVGVVTVPD